MNALGEESYRRHATGFIQTTDGGCKCALLRIQRKTEDSQWSALAIELRTRRKNSELFGEKKIRISVL